MPTPVSLVFSSVWLKKNPEIVYCGSILNGCLIDFKRISRRETILTAFKKKLAELVKEKMAAKERLGT